MAKNTKKPYIGWFYAKDGSVKTVKYASKPKTSTGGLHGSVGFSNTKS